MPKKVLEENENTGKIYNVAQDKWSLENVAKGIQDFYNQYNRYPTANDFDSYSNLPSARHIQRKFHGLKKLRETLKLKEKDFSTGAHSRERGELIAERQKRIKNGLYNFLLKKLGKKSILRDFALTDDARTNVDFKLRNEAQNCALDVFYSKDDRTLIGCINGKQKKFLGDIYFTEPVLFLSMNKDIGQERINKLVARKKNKLQSNHYILAWEGFESFLHEFKKNKKIEEILKQTK